MFPTVTPATTELILAQIECLAPGFRDRIVGTHTMAPIDLQDYNPNYVGGDIVGGLNSVRQLFARPALSTESYSTGLEGMYLCSASTPPGAGVHGMCGYRAARRAIDYLRVRSAGPGPQLNDTQEVVW